MEFSTKSVMFFCLEITIENLSTDLVTTMLNYLKYSRMAAFLG